MFLRFFPFSSGFLVRRLICTSLNSLVPEMFLVPRFMSLLSCWHSFVKDRVWKKHKGWKENSISRARRDVLIKVVVQ